MNLIKLLVFDCDGVIFDSKLANIHFYNYILKRVERTPLTSKEIEFIHMHSVDECIEYLLRDFPEKLKFAKEIQKETSYQMFFKYIKPERGLKKFLKWAKNYFYLAICTNRTTSTLPLLEYFNLRDFFDYIMTASKIPKNNPLALTTIIEHFSLDFSSVLYIGDSEVDKNLCEKCNVKMVAFKNPNLKTHFFVKNYKELRELIEKMFNFEPLKKDIFF